MRYDYAGWKKSISDTVGIDRDWDTLDRIAPIVDGWMESYVDYTAGGIMLESRTRSADDAETLIETLDQIASDQQLYIRDIVKTRAVSMTDDMKIVPESARTAWRISYAVLPKT